MSKQPSNSGERPIADPAPDSGEKPFDPSHFGRHQFPDGLREELIKAPKPRIDPKFLQDTVPPNRRPVLTDPDPVVTTPRGGFVAPKPPGGAIDRDAKTLIAAPAAKPLDSVIDRDPTTLIKLPTVKQPQQAAATKAAGSPSAPPVDTSRTDATIISPGVRKKNDKRPLVIGVVAALVLLLAIGLLIQPSADVAPNTATPSPKPVAAPDTTVASKPAAPPTVAPSDADSIDATQPAPSKPEGSTRPSTADSSAAKKRNAPSSKPLPNVKPAPGGGATPTPATSATPDSKPRDSLFSTVPVRPPAE
jgi:hypothetical protein